MSLLPLGAGLGALTATAATWAHAALRPQTQMFGRTIVAGDNPRELALTYDDGPNDACTEALLELLAQHDVKATFFMIGKRVRERPDIARAVLAAGHVVGNHTMTHPWLAWQSRRRIYTELNDCRHALEDALSAPVRFFRPPHGARRPAVMRIARELGMETVQWNAMGYDWRAIPAAKIVSNVQRELAIAHERGMGGNIVLHDGSDVAMGVDRQRTVEATRMMLERFAAEKRRFVTVDKWA